MVVRMRTTRGKTGSRRSHHALRQPAFSHCASCKGVKAPHRACPTCGQYRGRLVIAKDKVLAKKAKKAAEKKKAETAATKE